MKDTIRKFRSAIKRGTGETHVLLKAHPTIDFSQEIIKACWFNYAYDRQSEGVRDVYLSELIELCGKRNEILDNIYRALNDGDDDANLGSLMRIAAIFAKRGDVEAKKAIYKEFRREAINNGEWYDASSIVEIDGLRGLMFVAETVGEALLKHSDAWEDGWFVDDFQKENPTIDVYAELRKTAKTNEYVKKYLQEIKANKFRAKENRERPVYDYQYFRQRIDDKPKYIFGHVKNLSEDDLRRLADDFLKETKKVKQQKYLGIFSRVKFPYDYKPILQVAKSKNSRNNRVVEFAVEALQFFSGSDIRDFAVEVLRETKKPEDYTNLLVSNYRTGDWKLLKSIVEKRKNDDIIHALGSSYIDVYRANPTPECKEPLEAVYNKMNCGLHRRDLVKILIDNNVLSNKIHNEIQFDSDENTRKLRFEIAA